MTDQKEYQPGIYFGLPFDEYVKIPAMNASRLKLELVSPMDSWSRSHKNPVFDEIDDETKAKNEGRIYHKFILEGKEEFDRVYAVDFEDDPNDKTIIRTGDDIKLALSKVGAPTSFKVKDMGITMLLDADPKARILDVMKAEHRRKYVGREFIPAKLMREVELHNHVIRYNPELRRWLTGGYPEVTVIWDDPELGIRFKIRIDYLKLQFPVDLKTFANTKMKRVKLAILDAIATQKYHIQSSLYMRGVGASKYLVENGDVYIWDGGEPLSFNGRIDSAFKDGAKPELQKWLGEYTLYPVESFNFIFIQKGPAPVAMGNWIKKGSALDMQGLTLVTEAVRSHLETVKNFGDLPPLHLAPAEELQMDEMPGFMHFI